MKRKLIYGTALALICYAYYYALKNNQTIQKKPIFVKDWGIVTQEDIYPDTIDLRLYTSHGRLKYNN
jgi:uncharacterized membrane protein